MADRLWDVGVKVRNLEEEVERCEKTGLEVVLRYSLQVKERNYDLALVRLADKYIILGEAFAYERLLDQPLQEGCAHVVYAVEDFDRKVKTALEAGAKPIGKPITEDGALGKRRVALFETPGGMLLEYVQIITNLVPEI